MAANDLTDTKTLAHLLKYDSTLGPLDSRRQVRTPTPSPSAARRSKIFATKEPAEIDWPSLGVQVVVESTGRFTDATKAKAHLRGSVKKVIISAPATNEDVTIVLGVNDDMYDAGEAQHHLERVLHHELPRRRS